MMKAFLFLMLLVVHAPVRAQSTASWLDQQWDLLPQRARATKPSPSIPISSSDRQGIDLRVTPVARNTYLSGAYHGLAEDFGRCLNADMASWYHFGYRANNTSGRFINGERFRTMSPVARVGLRVLSALNIVHSEKEMITLFGRVNFLIGVEMVPAGRLFLATFCDGGELPAYDVFGQHLAGGDEARHELYEGYRQYYLALLPQNAALKNQLVAYGTSLLMMGEQRRAQNNVTALFQVGGPSQGLVETLYRWFAVSTTGLEIGHGVVIPFNKSVSTRWMSPEFAHVVLPGHRALHEARGVPLEASNGVFRGTSVGDWGNLRQRLRFLVAVVRGHGSRPELLQLD